MTLHGILLAAALALPAEEFAAKAAALEGKKDAKAWLALADWAGDRLLLDEREKALKAVLAFDPENARAHDLLDERKWDGAWLPVAEAEAREIEAMGAKGLVFYGTKWLPEKEADTLRGRDSDALRFRMRNRIDTPHLRVYTQWPLAPSLRLAWTLEHAVEAYARLYEGIWALPRKWEPVPVLAFQGTEPFRLRHQKTEREVEDFATSAFYPGEGLWTCADEGDDDRLLWRSLAPLVCALDEQMSRMECEAFPPWFHAGNKRLLEFGVKGRRAFPGAILKSIALMQPGLEKGMEGFSLERLLTAEYAEFQRGDSGGRIGQSLAFLHFLRFAENGRHAAGLRRFVAGLPKKGSLKDFEREVGRAADLEAPFKRYVEEVFLPLASRSRD